MVRVRNADTGAEADVPESALPILRASNWDLVPKRDVDKADKAVRDEAAAADRAMREAGLAAIPPESRPVENTADATQAERSAE
jgi:hypothetical protein